MHAQPTVPGGDEALPSVAFVLPVLNAAALLPDCLQTIADQDYPKEHLQIIVADGGSEDDTRKIAEQFGARVIHNPQRLAEPGVALGFREASADIVFVMAADNGLPRPDWIRRMVVPFAERPEVIGVYTQIIHAPEDNAFTRYYCRLHVEPFTWFVYGPASNPREFRKTYGTKLSAAGYIVYDFTPLRHPLIALAQGLGVRRTFERRKEYEEDDILPIIQMIEDGGSIAYVPEAGVYHHHLRSFGEFVRKYRWRVRNSLTTQSVGFNNRRAFMSRARNVRKILFGVYGLTVIGPVIDSIRLWLRERDACMLWHGPATVVLCWIIVGEYVRHVFRKENRE